MSQSIIVNELGRTTSMSQVAGSRSRQGRPTLPKFSALPSTWLSSTTELLMASAAIGIVLAIFAFSVRTVYFGLTRIDALELMRAMGGY